MDDREASLDETAGDHRAKVPRMRFLEDKIFSGSQRYVWIDIRCFTLLDGPCEPEQALSSLLAQPKYQEDYWSFQPAGRGLHGPYSAAMLRPDDFIPSTISAMTELLRKWAFEGWRRTEAQQRETETALQEAISFFGKPEHLLRLRDLGDAYIPGDFDVFGGEWLEFVGLWGTGEVRVLVAAVE